MQKSILTLKLVMNIATIDVTTWIKFCEIDHIWSIRA